jgi:hypothetical protein
VRHAAQASGDMEDYNSNVGQRNGNWYCKRQNTRIEAPFVDA